MHIGLLFFGLLNTVFGILIITVPALLRILVGTYFLVIGFATFFAAFWIRAKWGLFM